jgi:nucleotidyltransferase/DNA polymerase involved in DNA repair
MPVRRRARWCARLLRTVHNVSSESPVPNPGPRLATPLYACLYQPPAPDVGPVGADVLRAPLAARGESPASHRGRRGAPLTRPDDRAYREYVREEQRSQPGAPTARTVRRGVERGCLAGRMQLEFHHGLLEPIAREFSPRYERHHDHLVSIDVSGLERMLGSRTNHTGLTTGVIPRGCSDPARMIGEELRRTAVSRGVRVHVAVAATRMAALVLAHARPGVTIAAPGDQAAALAAIPIGILQHVMDIDGIGAGLARPADQATFNRWGVKTLGELAALPQADLTSRFGRQALVWQAIARGEDVRPLVPTLEDERFEASLDLEWPIDGLEPLSFVLTRLLEPLSTRLERRDRGTAVLHVILRLVTREPYARRLELPSPMRDVRTLRTLALLDLESHPPGGAIDRVTVVIDPTPGRILQHTLFTRAHPTPEQLSTLLARLAALMGQDRLGAPAMVDSYRPDAFAMVPFPTEHDNQRRARGTRDHDDQRGTRGEHDQQDHSAGSAGSAVNVVTAAGSALNVVVSALRQCRQPVPARVAVQEGAPVRVTTDRRGFAGGTVVTCVGPWRSSGNWWDAGLGRSGRSGRSGRWGEAGQSDKPHGANEANTHPTSPTALTHPTSLTSPPPQAFWDCDEWDVALTDGAVYRIFQDRATGRWFIDAIVD